MLEYNVRIPNLMSPVSGSRVGTWRPRCMIPVRLPWRLRARPSATLHEIQGQFRRADWSVNHINSQGSRQGEITGHSGLAKGQHSLFTALSGEELLMQTLAG